MTKIPSSTIIEQLDQALQSKSTLSSIFNLVTLKDEKVRQQPKASFKSRLLTIENLVEDKAQDNWRTAFRKDINNRNHLSSPATLAYTDYHLIQKYGCRIPPLQKKITGS